MAVDLASLIHKGGVYFSVEGDTPEVIYKKVTELMELPEQVSNESVYEALCAREKIMSTAVGNGVALPHARIPVIRENEDQRVCVIYPKNPVSMNAPDERKVSVMFMILTQNQQTHLDVLSKLVTLLQKAQFKKLLEKHAGEAELLNMILNLS